MRMSIIILYSHDRGQTIQDLKNIGKKDSKRLQRKIRIAKWSSGKTIN